MSTPLLISEHRLCDKGIIFVKNADCLIGLQHGIMVLYASASPLNPGENPLWLCDIHSLFKVKTIHHPSPTSIPIVQYLTELLESATVLANNSRGSYQVNRIMQGRRNNNIMGRWWCDSYRYSSNRWINGHYIYCEYYEHPIINQRASIMWQRNYICEKCRLSHWFTTRYHGPSPMVRR